MFVVENKKNTQKNCIGKMKIGILTFHCAHNYGAMLQCYALQEHLVSMGHTVKVINYQPTYLLKPYNVFDKDRILSENVFKMIKNILKELLLLPKRIRRYRAFNHFLLKRIHMSGLCDKHTITEDFDAYIFGSDQIWNPRITNGVDGMYFGCFQFPKGQKRYISYAASLGLDTIDPLLGESLKENLKNIDYISVREEEMVKLLMPYTNKPIKVVLDPTLLVSKVVWNKLSDNVKRRNYVLVYQVREDPDTIEFAKHIARQLNADIVKLVAWVKRKKGKVEDASASPEDFVSYIKHASCVVTTSFHGTAFSVIFNKPFYCLKLGDGCDNRANSLLGALSLDNRMFGKNERPTFSPIDYSLSNEKLEQMRNESNSFLSLSLKNM